MKGIIIGQGETGRALNEVLGPHYDTLIRDKEEVDTPWEIEIMHICFPYFDEFIKEVKRYNKKYSPRYTIIHSTVPVGTSRRCDAIHSPIRGIHPNLATALKRFTKFLGGEDSRGVADYFRRAGLRVYLTDKQETTELIKILSTTNYGLEIEFVKEVKRLCDEYETPFELWSLWVDTYNKGYKEMGNPEYKKPNLIPIMKKQGGHCVLPNADLLETRFTKLLKELDREI